MEETRKAEEALNNRKRLEMSEVSKKRDEAVLKKKVEEVKNMFKQEDEETRRLMEEARWKKMEGGVVDLTREASTSSGCGCDDCRYGNFSHNFTSFKEVFLTKYIYGRTCLDGYLTKRLGIFPLHYVHIGDY